MDKDIFGEFYYDEGYFSFWKCINWCITILEIPGVAKSHNFMIMYIRNCQEMYLESRCIQIKLPFFSILVPFNAYWYGSSTMFGRSRSHINIIVPRSSFHIHMVVLWWFRNRIFSERSQRFIPILIKDRHLKVVWLYLYFSKIWHCSSPLRGLAVRQIFVKVNVRILTTSKSIWERTKNYKASTHNIAVLGDWTRSVSKIL